MAFPKVFFFSGQQVNLQEIYNCNKGCTNLHLCGIKTGCILMQARGFCRTQQNQDSAKRILVFRICSMRFCHYRLQRNCWTGKRWNRNSLKWPPSSSWTSSDSPISRPALRRLRLWVSWANCGFFSTKPLTTSTSIRWTLLETPTLFAQVSINTT